MHVIDVRSSDRSRKIQVNQIKNQIKQLKINLSTLIAFFKIFTFSLFFNDTYLNLHFRIVTLLYL